MNGAGAVTRSDVCLAYAGSTANPLTEGEQDDRNLLIPSCRLSGTWNQHKWSEYVSTYPYVCLADHVQIWIFTEGREHHHMSPLVPCDCSQS